MDDVDRLVELMKEADYIVVLTGAGVSTESGLPDFRSPTSGLWQDESLMELLSTETLTSDPKRFFERTLPLLELLTEAQPNAAHRVLARWEERGLVKMLITQNIDSLHYEAGSRQLLEVHGQLRTASCSCGTVVSFSQLVAKVRKKEIPPRCACGTALRPDVVLFGDPMPASFGQAIGEVERSDLLLVVGSSLQVAPVAYLPNMARAMAIINLTPTVADGEAKVVLRGRAGEILSELDDRLTRG